MILAQHLHRQPQSDESTKNNEHVCLSNNIASWQSSNNGSSTNTDDKTIKESALVHRQPEKQQQIAEDTNYDDDDEDSFTYPSSDDEEDENKQHWAVNSLPEVLHPSVNNQITGSNRVNISNTNKNVYEGNVVIHQTFYNNLTDGERTNEGNINAVPTQKITIDKDTEAAVRSRLSNVSSHPLYPFPQEKVKSWCTKKRLFITFGAVLVVIVTISVIVYLTMPGNSYILGVPYVTRRQWVAQPPQVSPDKLTEYPPPYVIISHTATEPCYDRGSCVYTVRYIQTFHIESKGWDDISYNFLVGGDGSIYEGRGWDVEGAHTFNYNKKSIGISFIGTFTKKEPTDRQMYAAKKLIEYALQNKKLAEDYKLLGHRQCIKTESPGQVLYDIIKTWPHWSATP
ncbi:peptidoglycan-recognition protein LE-like isoform X2 [Phymastichus coffea]|uniref:peptidoglycan-recognition protein LE-like isoform X2 n=1 Tax=Phymastichus coffea TaxID=108790 RepID=UPI00273C6E1A|nr:peptidoglycan-recognition protein LE-like isoform X2 [Phymastichus coffea]